jgi:hypothetical protein
MTCRPDIASLGEGARRQIAAFRMAERIQAELRTSKRRDDEEERLQIAAVKLLHMLLPAEVVFFHVPNGGKRGKAEAGRFKAMGVLAGIPDLFFLYRSRAYAIEMKASDGVVSDVQKLCHAALAVAGIPVAVARSIDDVLNALKDWGIPVRSAR